MTCYLLIKEGTGMRKLVWPLFGLLLLAMTQSLNAAQRLGPPIEDLQSEPDRIQIVVAKAIKKPESPRIAFSISGRLSGESPDEVLLRTDEDTFADVVVGRSYVVAWSYMRRNRSIVEGWEEDPAGPFTVQLKGLGSSAVFEDSPEIRFLFAPGTLHQSGNSGKQIDALLGQLQREDFRSRGLVIAELWLRPDLTEAMNPKQVEALKVVIQKQALGPQHRDYLLRSTLRLPQDEISPWLAEELRKVIIEHGTQYDLRSFVPALVRTAARGLIQVGGRADIDLLSNLLYANNPGVAIAALNTMDHIDTGATVVKVEQAIERDWTQGETRQALVRYLKKARAQASVKPADSP
jgi:hypothetical protein